MAAPQGAAIFVLSVIRRHFQIFALAHKLAYTP
jgi:hypothetical protein